MGEQLHRGKGEEERERGFVEGKPGSGISLKKEKKRSLDITEGVFGH